MIVDDFYEEVDGDPDVHETVDQLFARLRGYKVVKLDFYRRMMIEYRGWRPLSLQEYRDSLRATQYQKAQRELEKARQVTNNRIKRLNKIKD